MTTRVAAALGFAVAISLYGCSAQDATTPRELKFGHVGEPGSLFTLSVEEFARRANERLPDGWAVVNYGSSQLGGDELLLQKIRLGTVDFALPSSILSSQIDEFGLFEMPYLVRDRAHMRAIEDDVVWPELRRCQRPQATGSSPYGKTDFATSLITSVRSKHQPIWQE